MPEWVTWDCLFCGKKHLTKIYPSKDIPRFCNEDHYKRYRAANKIGHLPRKPSPPKKKKKKYIDYESNINRIFEESEKKIKEEGEKCFKAVMKALTVK